MDDLWKRVKVIFLGVHLGVIILFDGRKTLHIILNNFTHLYKLRNL